MCRMLNTQLCSTLCFLPMCSIVLLDFACFIPMIKFLAPCIRTFVELYGTGACCNRAPLMSLGKHTTSSGLDRTAVKHLSKSSSSSTHKHTTHHTMTSSSSTPSNSAGRPLLRRLPPVPSRLDGKREGTGAEGSSSAEARRSTLRPVKTVVPKLHASAINLSAVRKAAFEEMVQLMEAIPAEKTLVLDPATIGPLSLVMPLSVLTSRGQVHPQIQKLDGNVFDPHCDTVVILARARVDGMRPLVHLLRHWQQSGRHRQLKVHLLLVPRRAMICEVLLERAGVYGMLQSPIGQYSGLDTIAFDNDLLSMEDSFCFREYAVETDNSSLFSIARSIMKLQSLYGPIPTVSYVGRAGETVSEMLEHMNSRVQPLLPRESPSEIDRLILLDRSVDLASPLVTPLTYEGLLDDLFGISNNLVNLSDVVREIQEKGRVTGKKQRLPLNDDDKIFQEIRHLHFVSVGRKLQDITRALEEVYEKRKTLQETSEIKEYFYKLPELQQQHDDLTAHVAIAQAIKRTTASSDFRRMIETEQNILAGVDDKGSIDFIERCIIRQEPLSRVLRLICLMSVVKNGFTQKEYDFFKKELVQSYGHFVLLTLENLEKAGLFKRCESKSVWPQLRKSLQLLEENTNEREPNSISYVHSGYAPMSVRIIEAALSPRRWSNLASVLGKGTPVGQSEESRARPACQPSKGVTLVYFIGGCTFAEISALRFLSTKCKCVVA